MSEDLQVQLNAKIAAIDAIADDFPGVIIIHNIKTQSVEYMSPRGQDQLKITIEELKALGPDYNQRFFNAEDAEEYVPKIFEIIQKNDEKKIVSFFQQVRPSEKEDYSWYFSTVKLLMRDDQGCPLLTITTAFPVDPKHHITSKVSRLLEENNFLRKNHHKFDQLTKREKEVLKLTVLGSSALETAEKLFISQNTVETHRRNLKKKLLADSIYELSQYARAFDLI